MTIYIKARCICGRHVGHVPEDPGRKPCACGLRLYYTRKGNIYSIFANDTAARPVRAWNRRKLRIMGYHARGEGDGEE